MNRLKIGIDLDDTLWKFHQKFFEYYNEIYDTNYSVEDHVEHSLEKLFGIPKREVFKLIEDFYVSKNAKNLELIEGAKEIIQKLNKKHDLYFITARNENFSDLTIELLNKYFNLDGPIFFVFDKNWNLKKEKVDFCIEKGINVMIDDRVKTLKLCVEKGIFSIMINAPWNSYCEVSSGLVRVNNWLEIEKELNIFLEDVKK